MLSIQHLYAFIDFQNALLPAGFRQKDQTTKEASGTFDREHLLAYLQKEAMEHQDREDIVPFTGEKKGNSTFASSSYYLMSTLSCVHRVRGNIYEQ